MAVKLHNITVGTKSLNQEPPRADMSAEGPNIEMRIVSNWDKAEMYKVPYNLITYAKRIHKKIRSL